MMKNVNELPTINVILCDDDSIHYIFSIATISANLQLEADPIILLSATPSLLGSDETLKRVIASEVRSFQYSGGYVDYDEEEDSAEPPYPDRIKFYLINIGPRNDAEMAYLSSFVEKHDEEIALWVDTSRDWLKSELHYINYQREIIKWDRTSTPLKLFGQFGYSSSAYWQEAEAALISDDCKRISANNLAQRYFKADRVAKVMDDNVWENNSLFCFLAALKELNERKTGSEINQLNQRFPKIAATTAKIKARIKNNPKLFPLSQRVKRSVGYINIGRLSNFIDIDDILAYGKKQFPWLVVIEYSGEGGQFIEVDSAKINLDIINLPITGRKDELLKLIKALDEKIASYKEPQKVRAPNARSS